MLFVLDQISKLAWCSTWSILSHFSANTLAFCSGLLCWGAVLANRLLVRLSVRTKVLSSDWWQVPNYTARNLCPVLNSRICFEEFVITSFFKTLARLIGRETKHFLGLTFEFRWVQFSERSNPRGGSGRSGNESSGDVSLAAGYIKILFDRYWLCYRYPAASISKRLC